MFKYDEQFLKKTFELYSKIEKDGWPPKIPSIFELAGLPPKLGSKTKTRRKIRKAMEEYRKKVKRAKITISNMKLGIAMATPLRRKFNYLDLARKCFEIQPLTGSAYPAYERNE